MAVDGKPPSPYNNYMCGCGGIGIHSRLKICRGNLGGSSPPSRTNFL